MILTLVGKLLGLLRERLLGTHFGSGMETAAFLTASQLPRTFFDVVFASAIAASFVPVFNEFATKKGKREALEFSGNFITVIGLLSLLLTVLGIIFAEPLVRLIAPGYDAATTALCASLTRVIFPTALFTGIAYCFVGILQSMDEFNVPALISVVANLIIVVYYYTFNTKYGLLGLAFAFSIGWLAQAAVQVPSLIRKGFYFKPSLSFRSEGMKKVFVLMIPALVSTWVQPINQTINTYFGSQMNGGAGVTAITFANNLFLIIIGVFILSVTNVIFPHLSRLTASNETAEFRETIRATVHASMYFVIPMTAGLMILSRPIVSLLFGGGKFDDFGVTLTSQALTFVSIGMIGYALQAVLSRAYFAKQTGRMPLVAGVASIAANIGLSALLAGPLGVTGLAVASAAAATVNAVVLIIPLEVKKEGFITWRFSGDILKMIVATLVMAAAVWGLSLLLDGVRAGKLWEAVTVAVPAAAGLLLYFAVTALFRLSEAKSAAAIVRKLTRRSKTDES